jgi:hypothetical protein
VPVVSLDTVFCRTERRSDASLQVSLWASHGDFQNSGMVMMIPNSINRSTLVMVCVLGWRGFVLAEHPPAASQAAKSSEDVPDLRNIPALQVEITGDFKAPKAQEIVKRLRAETKMDLTLADNINQEEPAFSSLSCHNVPAWKIMNALAKSEIIQGKWERNGKGFRLTSPLPPVIPKAKPTIQPSPCSCRQTLVALSSGNRPAWVREERRGKKARKESRDTAKYR